MVLVDYIGIFFLHVAILLATYRIAEYSHDFSLFLRSTGYM